MRHCLFAVILGLGLALGLSALRPAAAAPADLAGWGAARWDMTTAELEAAFGARLVTLPGRWIYGGAYAERAILETRVGGLAFTVYFQMNEETGRLQQVLLERRQQNAGPGSFQILEEALEADYGPASEACLLSPKDPVGLELLWRFSTTTVHATFLDFFSTSILYFDPSLDIDPLRPSSEERIVRRRTLPRRITLRFHPSDREDLMSKRRRCYPTLEALQADLGQGEPESEVPRP